MGKNSKGYVLCEKGHKAKKVPGEFKTYFCSECELKFTSNDPIRYPSSYKKKSAGPSSKKWKSPKTVLKSLSKKTSPKYNVKKSELFPSKSCYTCLHNDICARTVNKQPDKLKESCCRWHVLGSI